MAHTRKRLAGAYEDKNAAFQKLTEGAPRGPDTGTPKGTGPGDGRNTVGRPTQVGPGGDLSALHPGQLRPDGPPGEFGKTLQPLIDIMFPVGTEDLQREMDAKLSDQQRATDLATDVGDRFGAMDQEMERMGARFEGRYGNLLRFLGGVGEKADAMAGNVASDFARIKADFRDQARGAFDRVMGVGLDNLSTIMDNANRAAVGTVQGINSERDNILDQIQGDQSLTRGQKLQMAAQARFKSATAASTEVNKSKSAYVAMYSDASKALGNQLTSIQTAITQGEGALGVAEGQSLQAAHAAAANIHKGLADIHANANSELDNNLTQLMGVRSQAESMRDNILVSILPEQDDPFYALYDLYSNNYLMTEDVIRLDAADDHASESMALMQQAAKVGEEQGYWNIAMELFPMIQDAFFNF